MFGRLKKFFAAGPGDTPSSTDNDAKEHSRTVPGAPDEAAVWKTRGNDFLNQGKLADAEACYRRAVGLNPQDAESHFNLGYVLGEQKQYREAERFLRQALAINAEMADAWYFLGIFAQAQGEFDQACDSYRRAIAVKPDFAEACNSMGGAQQAQGALLPAIQSYRMALSIRPDFVEAMNNLGMAQSEAGELDEALKTMQEAIAIRPALLELHNNEGNILRRMGRLDGAVASFGRALLIKADYAEAHNNLGSALRELGQLDAALKSYHRALAIRPDWPGVPYNIGSVLRDMGRLDEAEESYRRALALNPDYADALSNLLFTYSYRDRQKPDRILSEARRFGRLALQQARPNSVWGNTPEPDRCLRIGLVSGDLREHPVGHFLLGVLQAMAAAASGRLEFFAYHNHVLHDALSVSMQSCCHGWLRTVGISDLKLAEQIQADKIDVLIDLSGHTAHNRLPLFAWKPAPVQVSWLGYFSTTGVSAIDYLIADPWTLPEAIETGFTETIWRLPETRLCFTAPAEDVEVNALPALRNGFITFGCFNNLTKMNDEVVALWARILVSVPGSRLFLKARQLDEVSARQVVEARFATHGVPRERLILEGFSTRPEYLAAYRRVDISLDPFPFSGGTTSAESLWMGVPVLSLVGSSFISRQGYGLLMNAGLAEFAAADARAYLSHAVELCGDPDRLAGLRAKLRQQALASPVFDTGRFAQHFENALRGMWRKWCRQQA